ncbi:hypothetical protein O181_063185 [Austropuccinia psidii MF-1]|uniref:Uncharacterized protein n=1 Tax=Austropuccinia psidii MF-1 TaxID=1389203 RepID=A0A9Q3EIC7_9BASI|nr:hypothetical protein [Austropuccinia psidii MF-1]
MIKVQEPSIPWEMVHNDWVNSLSPGGDRSYEIPAYALAERVIQNLEEMVRNLCAYGWQLKYWDGITNDWCTRLPALEQTYKTSSHASSNQTPAIPEKVWSPRLPQDSLRKDLVEIYPTADSFKSMLEKARKHALRLMKDSFS